MVHATYGTSPSFYITTEEYRFDKTVPNSQIKFLFKFTNDMSKDVKYVYDAVNSINFRSTFIQLVHGADDKFTGAIDLTPFGHWKFEVYEVSYNGTVPTLDKFNSPQTETDEADSSEGVFGTVQGLVEKGKLFVEETAGSEQVQYTQRQEPTSNNYIFLE